MSTVVRALLPLILVHAAAGQVLRGHRLDCMIPRARGTHEDYELVRPGSAEELSRLHKAPRGAERRGRHQLQVNWVSGKRVFTDGPPYDEPLDGVWWAYCGYDSNLRVHAHETRQGGMHRRIAGRRDWTVIASRSESVFSPDGKYYLAYEQPDGQDGETRNLYRRNGTKPWEGYNGILHNNGKWVGGIAEFKNMQWDSQDRLQADAEIPHQPSRRMTLTRTKSGKMEWLPRIPDDVIKEVER